MKKKIKISLLAVLLSLSVNYCSAQEEKVPTTGIVSPQITAEATTPAVSTSTTMPTIPAISSEIPVSTKTEAGVRQAPTLVAPVVEDPQKRLLKPANRKIDLHAIIFDPSVTVKSPEVAEEMTQAEIAKYKINEALRGEVSTTTLTSTKGLLEDTMKMTFEKGPIESLAPWFDYNGSFSNIWNGETYQNTTYGINFMDVGVNGKFRDGKTVFRIMFNPGRVVEGNTYFQSFLDDLYIIRDIGKHNKILLGNTWVPIGMEAKESPFTIPFFGRSQISRTYGTSRALGVKLMGDYKLVEYHIGGYSSERYLKDWFPGPEFAGLVSLKPLGLTNGKYGKLLIGGSLDAGNSDTHFCVAGTHLIYEYKRLKASLEYATAEGSNGSTGFSRNPSEGFYGTLAYRVTPRIQALVRYDQFDPNKNKGNDIRREYTAGINYFVKGQALKLMLNYVLYSVENGTYGSRIMVGTQIIL